MELEGGFEAWKENELDIEEALTNRLKPSAQPLRTTR